MPAKALVLLSGGQDSSTCLFWALTKFDEVTAIFFDYDQRHLEPEREAARTMCDLARIEPPLNVNFNLDAIQSSDLLRKEGEFAERPDGLPTSFVPGRNATFLSIACGVAKDRGIDHIVTGVCETDYSGYPDCRAKFVDAMQEAMRLGLDHRELVIHTPLMYLNKAQTWELMRQISKTYDLSDRWFRAVRDFTHTCYNGDTTKQPWGRGCGVCPACKIRKAGYEEWAESMQGQRPMDLEGVTRETTRTLPQEDRDYGGREIEEAATKPIETWPNEYMEDGSPTIHLEFPEYTALCPRSGYPDFGTIVIDYLPHALVGELKSLKLYINSFRHRRISHENVVGEIADKLNKDLMPVAVRVIGDFTRRGGVKTVVTAERSEIGEFDLFEPYDPNIL